MKKLHVYKVKIESLIGLQMKALQSTVITIVRVPSMKITVFFAQRKPERDRHRI